MKSGQQSKSTDVPIPLGESASRAHVRPTGAVQGEDLSAATIVSIVACNRELQAELEHFRAERNRLLETERRIMELLGTHSADQLVHDLRNLLNERDLLKALLSRL